jgi:hypothetical protein
MCRLDVGSGPDKSHPLVQDRMASIENFQNFSLCLFSPDTSPSKPRICPRLLMLPALLTYCRMQRGARGASSVFSLVEQVENVAAILALGRKKAIKVGKSHSTQTMKETTMKRGSRRCT